MPRLIEASGDRALSLAEAIDTLDATMPDPRDEDAFAALAPLLAGLARDREFLAELAVAELKTRCRDQSATSGYGAQVLLLRPTAGRYGLRANFWPAAHDAAVRASGPAPFLYGHCHDHNFSFLTVGYLGPGYWSDFYEAEYDALDGVPGEHAGLRFTGRERLAEGQVMLYRRHRDVHAQLPPDSFSVSLNILGYGPEQCWLDQYRFDPAADTIAGVMTQTPSQALLAAGVALGCGEAVEVAEDFAVRHPSDRMRLTALDALARRDGAARRWERAAASRSAWLAAHARKRLTAIDRSGSEAVGASDAA